MSTAEAIRLAVILANELNALMQAYKTARDDGRDDLSDNELKTFSVRATDTGSRLQLKIDNL